jgi:hypothetical protein
MVDNNNLLVKEKSINELWKILLDATGTETE